LKKHLPEHFISTRMAIIKKTITNVEAIDKLGPSPFANGNGKWCGHFGK
jgi:hypothetical protein